MKKPKDRNQLENYKLRDAVRRIYECPFRCFQDVIQFHGKHLNVIYNILTAFPVPIFMNVTKFRGRIVCMCFLANFKEIEP